MDIWNLDLPKRSWACALLWWLRSTEVFPRSEHHRDTPLRLLAGEQLGLGVRLQCARGSGRAAGIEGSKWCNKGTTRN